MPKAKPFSATPNVDSDTFDDLHPKVTTHRKKREKSEETIIEASPPTPPLEESSTAQPERTIEDELREQLAREQQRLLEAERAAQEAQQRAAAAERAALAAQQQVEAENRRAADVDQASTKDTQKPFPPKKPGVKSPAPEPEEERRLTVRVSTQISQKLVMLSEALGIDETGCMRLGLIELWERHVKAGLLPSPRDTTL